MIGFIDSNITMEKLLKLIHKYEDTRTPRAHDSIRKNYLLTKDKKHIYIFGQWYEYCETWIISKRYGFIKRLYENNMIERISYTMNGRTLYDRASSRRYGNHSIDPLRQIIFVLADLDDPISFLVSTLK